MAYCFYLTHPNVVMDPAQPVSQWQLSEKGKARLKAGFAQSWLTEVGQIVCSQEAKAFETGQILAQHFTIPFRKSDNLQEIDRSSAGFLENEEFEVALNQFYSHPSISYHGWETAEAAQQRIVEALRTVCATEPTDKPILFIGHGTVGTLLRCHLANAAISREHFQPASAGGGCWFKFASKDLTAQEASLDQLQWQRIDSPHLVFSES